MLRHKNGCRKRSTREKTHWKDLFAGFPRTVIQAEKLGEKQDLDVVVNLDVPFETIIDRISVSTNEGVCGKKP